MIGALSGVGAIIAILESSSCQRLALRAGSSCLVFATDMLRNRRAYL